MLCCSGSWRRAAFDVDGPARWVDSSYADLMASWRCDLVMKHPEVLGGGVTVALVVVGVCCGDTAAAKRVSSLGRFTTWTVRRTSCSTSTSCCTCVCGCCVRIG